MDSENRHRRFPHIGRRIMKTAVAVFLCLVVYMLRGIKGGALPAEAAITAIICMQPYVQDSRVYALNRLAGTLMGAFWGLVFLLLFFNVPAIGEHLPLLYLLMAVGTLLSLYTAILVRMPDTAGLAAIVFICVVIAFPDIDRPFHQAVQRMIDVFTGTTIAILVNVFRLPRIKHRERLFFIHAKDLVPDRLTPLPPAVMFRLNYLYNDGAKISLMSEHAPAFLALQMNEARPTVPMIVMDGAAIYDAAENRFLYTENIPEEVSAPVMERLESMGVSYYIYTVRDQQTRIFHRGATRPEEKLIFDRMRRSPYRSYLEGEILDPAEIVYLKVIGREEEIRRIEAGIRSVMPKGKLRRVIRPEAGDQGLTDLYIYSHFATLEQAASRLTEMLRQEEPGLVREEIRPKRPRRDERDSVRLLEQVEQRYEPVGITISIRNA